MLVCLPQSRLALLYLRPHIWCYCKATCRRCIELQGRFLAKLRSILLFSFIDEEAMKTKAKIKSSSLITCYVIAYDIPDDKRRTKIHKVLLGFGKWTQYSLFECFLSGKDLILLRSKLAEHLVAR